MAELSDSTNWSEVDANNNKPSPNGWPEGMMPSGVNDSARADKGALKRFWNRANPVQVITPASGAFTFTTANPTYPTAYVEGELYSFKPAADGAPGATFQVNSLGAKPIYKRQYSSPLNTPVALYDIVNGYPAQLVYQSALNGGAGGFLLVNPFLPVIGDGAGGISVPGSISVGGTLIAGATTLGSTTLAGLTVIGDVGVGGAQGITYSAFTGGGSDNSQHRFRFGWTGSNLVVSVDSTGGLQLANTNQLAGYLPLSGGSISGGLTVSGQVTGNSGATAFYGPNGNLVVGGSLNFAGLQISNNSGYVYSGSAFLSGSSIVASSALFCGGTGGPYWQNNGGNMSTPQGLYVTGGVGGNVGIRANQAVQSDIGGTAFYAPNGNVVCLTCSANNFNNTSDAALKTDIAASAIGLDAVLGLAPRAFRWKAAPEKEELGLIAQEVERVLPQAVSTTEDDLHGPLMGINFATIATALIGAVKELAVRVATLEAK